MARCRAVAGVLRRVGVLTCGLVLVFPLGAYATGGSGKVGPLLVGPLRVHQATDEDVREWAGKPSRVWTLSEPGRQDYRFWRYRHSQGRRTTYGFARAGGDWLLEEFFTTSRRFSTRRGTKAGMPYVKARRREPGARYVGADCLPPRLRYFKEGGFLLELFLAAERPAARVEGLSVSGPLALGCS
jgi:hypothetical protein